MSNGERRIHKRRRVHFGAQADVAAASVQGVIRNFSEGGACVEFAAPHPPRGEIDLTVARKNRAYKAKVIWRRENKAGVAFQSDAPSIVPQQEAELEEKLRKSERKVRKLRNRVRELTGG